MVSPYLKLRSGYEIPTIGLGTWLSKQGEVGRAVEKAIEVGYRHIDGAWMYQNETEIGESLQKAFKSGKCKREDVFLTSKLWGMFQEPKAVKGAMEESLRFLQTSYLDLYMMHLPFGLPNTGDLFPIEGSDVDYVDTWKALVNLQKEGLTRSVGVCNFNLFQLKRLIKETSIVPDVIQLESNPYLTSEDVIDFCKEQGILVTAYATFGSPTRPWVKQNDPVLLEDPVLKRIAVKHGKSVAHVALRFQLQRGLIVIPKSVKPSRIESNFQVYDFKLSSEEMKKIFALNKDWRAFGLEWFGTTSKYQPFQPNYSED